MTIFHLGLSTSGHDPALAIVDETGRVMFAEATERFVQDKRAWGIAPDHVNHLEAALAAIGFDPQTDELRVATSWKTVKADLPVQLSNALLPATDGRWLRQLHTGIHAAAGASLLRLGLAQHMPEVSRFDHHLCHAVAASLFAPVEDAACLVIDGEGEVGAVSLFDLRDRKIRRRWRSWGPGSLGTLYAWLTGLCGFDWRLGEEWKVMGLAAYGKVRPELRDVMSSIVSVEKGRLRFADEDALVKAHETLRPFARSAGASPLEAADLAASGQAAFSELADQVLTECLDGAQGNLILSGGCALNSSYNGTIAGRTGFERVFVPPAPADDGNAIGAAILSWMQTTGTSRIPVSDGSPFLGSTPSRKALARLSHLGRFGMVSDISGGSAGEIARRLEQGKIIGVMRGRAEFGPRALGNRSILADPRSPDMKERLNRDVKGREPYRPFAPVIAEETVSDWFERPQASAYMSFALPWRDDRKDLVPAVVHEDGTGRLQTVSATNAPWMYDVVQAFGALTGVPIVLNTSFNIMGKPIVHSIEDALALFMTSGLDAVLIGELLLEKRDG
ncbi:carbamoyltransferase C-terminal domain-containing protein [Breoghania sp. L-A4]|uniref:carbamoyltransferase family protein n=1 Tax=Breoghania sp. L-A4 TaxID=2304600 RepID=UPI000E35A7E2|nr:carbamoyltransferase C-terminal domain-containing protein [Breoghania sp. L-A4]AXS39709.1 carbamoyl transferase [Breoghania sp. L-A4]